MPKTKKKMDRKTEQFLLQLDVIDKHVEKSFKEGHKVLQFFRFAENEHLHVARLLNWAEFKLNSKVIDLGCGTGEVSRIMSEIRKDLSFCLVNISEFQLGLTKADKKHCCDFCNVPEPDHSFDAAMFCFSIGQSDANRAIKEAFRLINSGGVLFIFDMVRENKGRLKMPLEVAVNRRSDMETAAKKAGFILDLYMEPYDNGEYGRLMFGANYEITLDGAIPAIWRFTKK